MNGLVKLGLVRIDFKIAFQIRFIKGDILNIAFSRNGHRQGGGAPDFKVVFSKFCGNIKLSDYVFKSFRRSIGEG